MILQRCGAPLDPGLFYLVLISCEPKINNRTVQEEKTGTVAQQEEGTAKCGMEIVGEAQGGGGSGRKVNRAAVLSRRPGQVEVPAELRADVSAHGFWKRGTTTIFDIRIVNLDAGSYLCMTSENALSKGGEGKEGLIPSGLPGL